QRRMLAENYLRDSALLPVVVERAEEQVRSLERRDIDVLWVANLRALKRPERYIAMARALPRFRFHLVGGEVPAEAEVARQVAGLARDVGNLVVHGRLAVQTVSRLFGRARVFVNTSQIEGFPNTYLQAWACGTPVVAHFDPDDLIRLNGLGEAVADD